MRYHAALRRAGFTLIELLVVIAIIAVLIALLLPAIQAAREAANRSTCTNHLKQIGLALQTYHDVHSVFPNDTYTYFPDPTDLSSGQARNFTWITYLLPHMDQQALYDRIDFNRPIWGQNDANGKPIVATKIGMLQCPSDDYIEPANHYNIAQTNYAGTTGWDSSWRMPGDAHMGIFGFRAKVSISNIKDGTSKTIAVGEVNATGFKMPPGSPASSRYGGTGIPRNTGGNNSNEAVFRMWGVAMFFVSDFIKPEHQFKMPDDSTTGEDGSWWKNYPYTHGPFYRPYHSINSDWPGPSSLHRGGANFVFADGSVHFISEDVDYNGSYLSDTAAGKGPSVWIAINTINSGVFESRLGSLDF